MDQTTTVISAWRDPTLITAYTGALVLIIGAIGAAVVKVVSVLRQVENTTKVEHETTRDKVQVQDKKLDDIQATTAEALDNTNGNVSKLQDELTRRSAREEVLERMVSELTTVLSAQRAVPPPLANALPGRRASDPPITVRVVETALSDKDKKETS